MARTKQTAARSTGGKAPVKNLTAKAARRSTGDKTIGGKVIIPGKVPKKRTRVGLLALKEIRRYQLSTDKLIPRLRFQLLVREIHQDLVSGTSADYISRYQRSAMECLQDASEDYIQDLFEMAQLCAIHAGRVEVRKQDIVLVQTIRKERTNKRKEGSAVDSGWD